ncbi:SpvB/TcaC N-terminal domain-containing protein [Nocardia pseudovaccinii]|uniref:SpvB/TcaC N-terminal domain-containing protein n=1 Tax=Nocardia pseudovaccinii TaxID=189540 RepID=UPI0007A45D2B|nr:SpvB/TcaC N-terminal domain-containing protein [Nocardia pseudovaccinii]
MGEQFSANPVTGTAALSVPVALTAGREGATPQLSLGYDSGSGNGPFGLGWSLAVPSISRRTDKGVPRYLDDSDIFQLTGAEDLVPAEFPAPRTEGEFEVIAYRPRTEGLYALIERRRDRTSGATHWRMISRDNVVSVFGSTAGTRIDDPSDPSRTFRWLLESTADDRGNLVRYEYKAEDRAGVDTAVPYERNRTPVNRYLKRIRYANATPGQSDFRLEAVLDYGEHTGAGPTPVEDAVWPVRRDPFSSSRSGFDIRTYRLCRRILMFHHFPELGPDPVLVASTDLTHESDPAATKLVEITHAGYLRIGDGYTRKALPSLRFDYIARNSAGVAREVVGEPGTAPVRLDAGYRWADLDGEGIAGILAEQDGAWYYRANRGGGVLAAAQVVDPFPLGATRSRTAQLLDLAGDGGAALTELSGPTPGFHRRTAEGGWSDFTTFASLPVVAWDDANLRLVDLTGDGLADVLLTGSEGFTWHPSAGYGGFGDACRTLPEADEERGPLLVFADPEQSIYLADMSGDGLTDLVRIRNGEIAYWPNLGHGRFGAKIRMANAPVFDHPDRFDQRRIRLADIDGSAPTDLIYLGSDGIRLWFNESGNGWSAPERIDTLVPPDLLASTTVTDLLGAGTACVVIAEPRPEGEPQVRYVDLMAAGKPHLLAAVDNRRGLRTRITYTSSTSQYLADRAANRPWATRLPFPVQVVSAVEVRDEVADTTLTTTYRYRHGYYDGVEREFRGFGYLEQCDALTYSSSGDRAHQPPVVVKRWQHTGWYLDGEHIAARFAAEYWPYQSAFTLTATPLPTGTTDEQREVARALRGHVLREEIYSKDAPGELGQPYAITETTYRPRILQRRAGAGYAVVAVDPGETLSLHTERHIDDPRIGHTVTLEVDEWGSARRTAEIAYPRTTLTADPEQQRMYVTAAEHRVVHDVDAVDRRRVGIAVESRVYEIGGLHWTGSLLTEQQLRDALTAAVEHEIPYQKGLSGLSFERRLIACTQQSYASADAATELPLGSVAVPLLPWQNYQQVFADGQVGELYGNRVSDAMLTDAGYLLRGKVWWVPSGRKAFDPARFYLPIAELDPFGARWHITYDPHVLRQVGVTDPLENASSARLNYRVLQPWLLTDANRNRTGVRFDPLGLVVATAVMGKAGAGEGDSLDIGSDEAAPGDSPTTWLEYDLAVRPVTFRTFAREQHGIGGRIQQSNTYLDGTGRIILRKVQAEPADDGTARWVGTGRTIHDNKGNPIKKYEPYFAPDGGFDSEPAMVMSGVTVVVTYDPLSRPVRTDHPDGSLERVVFDVWSRQDWDRNDTLFESDWYTTRIALPPADARYQAARATESHGRTPSEARFDALGRAYVTIADNGIGKLLPTRVVRDIQGLEREIYDPRGIRVLAQDFDMLGHPAHGLSADAGERWTLLDVTGNPVRGWDGRGTETRWRYDQLHRPTQSFATLAGGAERLRLRYYYGEAVDDGAAANLRMRPYLIFDGAGVVRTVATDFKGNVLTTERRLAADPLSEPDWTLLAAVDEPERALTVASGLLETTAYPTGTTYDALNRSTAITGPDGSITRPAYNEANLLERIDTRVRGAADWTAFVTDIDYNARGQRTRIALGCGAVTEYRYEDDTFRLSSIDTTGTGTVLQALRYTYDPVGNISITADPSVPTVFFDNAAVGSTRTYTYDPIYRLTSATGREHIGQTTQPGPADPPQAPIPHANDSSALRAYLETYGYDDSGNLTRVAHTATGGSWTRRHATATDSNRLPASSLPGDGDDRFSAIYTHDANGNITSMPHLQTVDWDAENRLVRADLGGGGTAYYQYDATGQRVRATVRANATSDTRIYLGGNEIYQRTVAGAVRTRREILHVMDGTRRVALVETTVVDDGVDIAGPIPVQRYQFGDHLGSATIELDGAAAVLSYEEYHPFGTSSYRSARTAAEISLKRYRYTGKEKDAETGFYYHGSRYYAVWLGRWISGDPAGFTRGIGLYEYVRNNPVRLVDPTGNVEETPAQSSPPPAQVQTNKAAGAGAQRNIVRALEAKGHGVRQELVTQGGKGGSRVDIAPDPSAPRTIGRTLESKHLDLDAYRAAPGGPLDTKRLEGVVRENVEQVLKHQKAARATGKPEVPFRETLIYTLENARPGVDGHPGEAEQFQDLARSIAGGKDVKVGVLQEHGGIPSTASGRSISTFQPQSAPSTTETPHTVQPTPATPSTTEVKQFVQGADVGVKTIKSLTTAEHVAEKTAGKVAAKYAGKAVPGAGIVVGIAAAGDHADKGEYFEAGVDLVESIPGVADAAIVADITIRYGVIPAFNKVVEGYTNLTMSLNRQLRF